MGTKSDTEALQEGTRLTSKDSQGLRLKFKAVSAERGQLSLSKVTVEVRTSNQQVARVDSRLPIAGALPPAVVALLTGGLVLGVYV